MRKTALRATGAALAAGALLAMAASFAACGGGDDKDKPPTPAEARRCLQAADFRVDAASSGGKAPNAPTTEFTVRGPNSIALVSFYGSEERAKRHEPAARRAAVAARASFIPLGAITLVGFLGADRGELRRMEVCLR